MMETGISLFDTDMMQKGRIITYGLTEKEREIVYAAMGQGLVLVETDEVTDLIAVPAFMLIIRGDALTADERQMVIDYYREVGEDANEFVCWIAPPERCVDLPWQFRCRETVEEAVTLRPQEMCCRAADEETCEDLMSADTETAVSDALIDSVTAAQFDAMVLLAEASVGNYVLRADVNTVGDIVYYEMFDSEMKDVSLLAISHRDEVLDQAYVEAIEPDYEHYICVAMTREEKAFYIEHWLCSQSVCDLPPLLRELAVQTNRISQ